MVEAVSYTGSRNPGRGGSGGAKAKEEKARSCTIAHAPAARIFYGRSHRPKASHFPLALYPIAWEEGIQREKGKVVFGRSRSGRRIYLYRRPCSESRSFFIWIPGAISCKVSREKVKTPKGKRLGYIPQGTDRIVSRRPCQLRSPDGTIRDDGGSLTLCPPACPPPTFSLWMPWTMTEG